MEQTKVPRTGEELNSSSLLAYLKKELKDLPEGDLVITQFQAGHSNLTYLLQIGDYEAVLRRPPMGPVAKRAHDMARESTVMAALAPHLSIIPRPLHFCSDPSIIGAPFFLMERKQGIVLDTEFPSDLEPTKELGHTISTQMVDRLVDLHAIDYKKTKLVDFTRPEGFLERQVHGWIKRYHQAKTDDHKGLEELTAYLADSIPASKDTTVIHYDYKLNNAMFSKDGQQMVGLFDWEMTTVGDPLCDVGVALSYWIESNDPDLLKRGFGKPPVTVNEGFFTRRDWVSEYAKKSGREVENIEYYLTFAYFKLAVIAQQIYYRYHKGQTNDKRFQHFNHTVQALILHGRHTASTKL
ncbi:phosphotransferase family protein [Alkalihalophilus pseudofirmus]|uniref:Phosphotransferase family protein n=1 Tax=Alkalihalophilus pseudofirmus TaxID=79885 RepID=A0AAJ2KS92_ALKPS|nr:phosphotransferase family protein [Alkalihalophilus pseudofirmus]MDV2883962.1 phosphotransferase family protein [Alkalihalophilus pseudofirmus]